MVKMTIRCGGKVFSEFGWGPMTRRSFPRAKRFRAKMHKGTFSRANRSARKCTLVHLLAETFRAEKIGALSDPAPDFGRHWYLQNFTGTYI